MTASAHAHPRIGTRTESPAAYQAYHILHAGFTILPILAGADKFTHVLVDWDKYVAPAVARIMSPHPLLLAVGVVEIVAGLLVWIRPRIGAYLVMAWLWAIIVNLLMIPGYYDIALRDFGLSLGALALARLSKEYSSH
jgi:hypothetical protein